MAYRHFPVVRELPRAVCADCVNAWRIKDIVVACDVVARVADDWDTSWAPPPHDGDCSHYHARPWLRLLERLGIRKLPTRFVIKDAAKVDASPFGK